MALAGPLAGARLIALDTSTFIYLIEKHPVFFGNVLGRGAPSNHARNKSLNLVRIL